MKIIKWVINNSIKINYIKKKIELHKPNHIILYYHRVIKDNYLNSSMGPNVHLCVAQSEFKKQMDYIKENFNLISINDLYNSNFNCNKFSVAVTFDDGYLDNFNIAYPILKKLSIPATIYLVSKNFTDKPWAWWVELWNFISDQEYIKFNNTKFLTKNLKQKERVFFIIKDHVKKMNYSQQVIFFEKLTNNNSRENHQSLFMQKKDIIEMKQSELITFGCHTHNHLCFANFDFETINKELEKSKSILENEIGLNISHFAYPYGTEKDINFFEHELLKKHNFRSAVTTSEIIKNEFYQFYLPRISIGPYVKIADFKRKLTGFDILLKKIIG